MSRSGHHRPDSSGHHAFRSLAPADGGPTGRTSMPAAPAKEGGCRGGLEDPERSQTRQALGRSRGGLTTKVHLAADGRGLPLVIVLMPGNINDSTVFESVMNAVRVPRTVPGRPRIRPDQVLADEAYSSRVIRTGLRGRESWPSSPNADQIANRKRRGSAGGRPPTCDTEGCKARSRFQHCGAHRFGPAAPSRTRYGTRAPFRRLSRPATEPDRLCLCAHGFQRHTPHPEEREEGSRGDVAQSFTPAARMRVSAVATARPWRSSAPRPARVLAQS
ncbi:hypothetical protein FHS35_008859 [Streptomyces umbrinus]|nr:hypothetical protein [Streptomyces umbrinus]